MVLPIWLLSLRQISEGFRKAVFMKRARGGWSRLEADGTSGHAGSEAGFQPAGLQPRKLQQTATEEFCLRDGCRIVVGTSLRPVTAGVTGLGAVGQPLARDEAFAGRAVTEDDRKRLEIPGGGRLPHHEMQVRLGHEARGT